MKKLLGLALASVIASAGFAQSLDEYLNVRRASKITATASAGVLHALVGTKALEVSGTVQGIMSSGELTSILFKLDEGDTIRVVTRNAPEWLDSSEMSVRLLIKATREKENSELSAFLLGAVTDAQIAPVEAAERNRKQPAASPKTSSSTTPSGLSGTIGSRGSKLTSRSTPAKTPRVVPAAEAVNTYAAFIKNRNKKLTDAQAIEIASGVIGFSIQYGVDARLVMAILIVESGFNPNATSRSGAMGLGQLMPATARGLGVSNAYNTTENLYGTVRTIRGHLERYNKQTGGDAYQALILSLAAYNAGSGAVRRHGGVPPYRETQNYVVKVTETYRMLAGG
jgi:soluble lytic murein transglycosylase-like protein